MKTILLTVAVLGTLGVAGQPNDIVPKNIRATNTLDNLFDANGLATTDHLWGIPLEPGRVVGTTYLTEDWNRTTIMLRDTDKLIEGYHTRYEIDLDQIEIRTAKEVKILDGRNVESFVWLDDLSQVPHYFVNARDYRTEDGESMGGFFEVLSEGPLTLFSRTSIYVKEPNYNVALDMGIRDTRVMKKTVFYYFDGDFVRELPSSRKKLLSVLPDGEDEVGQYIKTNKLSLNEAQHLKILFDHYNQHIATN